MNFNFVFWIIMTLVMGLGIWIIDEIPIKVIKIVVFAQLAIMTMEMAIKELKPKREGNLNDFK